LAERDIQGGAYAGRPSVCRACGALVGAGEADCAVCGAPLIPRAPDAPPPPHHDPATVRFLRAVFDRPATFTFAFIIANVFLYLLMSLDGGARGEVLVRYGAKLNYLIDAGEWWRFVTPVFLHVQMPGLGPLHLLTNMYGLFMLGPYVEKLYGSARFVVIWITTGIAGVAASYFAVQPELAAGSSLGRFLFKAMDVPSAGASGALFGLVGVLFVFGIKYRHELPEGLKRAFGTGMLPIILINLFIGYVGSGFIDNAAHLGGLVSGMALALLVEYKRIGERGPVSYAWHFLQAACLLVVVAGFVMVALKFNRPLAAPEQPPPAEASPAAVTFETVQAFVEAMNAGQAALDAYAAGRSALLAPAIQRLEQTPDLNERADALRDELKTLLARARDLAAEQKLPRAEMRRRAQVLAADYAGWERRFNEWVVSEGGGFGIVIKDAPPAAQPPEPQGPAR
jgi:rhomboid protease GluP